jgi:hypothetical protein
MGHSLSLFASSRKNSRARERHGGTRAPSRVFQRAQSARSTLSRSYGIFALRTSLATFCRETGHIPRSASRCQMIARVERALRRAFNKRVQERPLHLERFATETS